MADNTPTNGHSIIFSRDGVRLNPAIRMWMAVLERKPMRPDKLGLE
jgi:hypothetical protein